MRKEIPEARRRWLPFFPDHFLSELTVLLAMALVLIVAVQMVPYPLEERADPTNTPMGAKPPWYFYFLYELLKYFPPLLAAVAIPAVGISILFALPFIDTHPGRRPGERKLAVALGALAVLALGVLTYLATRPYAFE